MLKKSLFAFAVVAMLAVMAQGGEIKTHQWPTGGYVPLDITEIPVLMDVGYWVRIKDQDKLKIKMSQNTTHEYAGCKAMVVQCNFNVILGCSISSNGVIPGKYDCGWNGTTTKTVAVASPGATVDICAQVKDANLNGVAGGSNNVQVATVTINVVPDA